jgi:hypothetical protein
MSQNRRTENDREIMANLTEIRQVGPDPDTIIDEIHGLTDNPRTSLARIPGKVICSSGVLDGPVWSLHQLRFRDAYVTIRHAGDQFVVTPQPLPPQGGRFPMPIFSDGQWDNPNQNSPPFPLFWDWPTEDSEDLVVLHDAYLQPPIPSLSPLYGGQQTFHYLWANPNSLDFTVTPTPSYLTFLVKKSDWWERLGCYVIVSWNPNQTWFELYHPRDPGTPFDEWYWPGNLVSNGELVPLRTWRIDDTWDELFVLRFIGPLGASTTITIQATDDRGTALRNPDGALINDTVAVIGTVLSATALAEFNFFDGLGDSITNTFTITNGTSSPVVWNATLDLPAALAGLVTVTPSSGTLAGGASQVVSVTMDSTGVAVGAYDGTIEVDGVSVTFESEVHAFDGFVDMYQDLGYLDYFRTFDYSDDINAPYPTEPAAYAAGVAANYGPIDVSYNNAAFNPIRNEDWAARANYLRATVFQFGSWTYSFMRIATASYRVEWDVTAGLPANTEVVGIRYVIRTAYSADLTDTVPVWLDFFDWPGDDAWAGPFTSTDEVNVNISADTDGEVSFVSREDLLPTGSDDINTPVGTTPGGPLGEVGVISYQRISEIEVYYRNV